MALRRYHRRPSGLPLDENGQVTKPLVVGIRMGSPKQHVGTRQGQRLYQAILDAINTACPTWERKKTNCLGGVTDSTAKIEPIVYDSDANTYASNAYLKVTVHYGFSNPAFPRLACAMYQTAAFASAQQTLRPENCY
ncbi:hypothetical protein EK21DRAFT_94601 [Setomelanomma holmii]|uniref:Uncharacterized protein n=1 Tax=Setomelanomma holmii TaxID=210430 RepID=A0A9P4GXI2_9PLEO|nr:hypothetical protein EK21DRAFT_94601 [Setomelanomma holmii]